MLRFRELLDNRLAQLLLLRFIACGEGEEVWSTACQIEQNRLQLPCVDSRDRNAVNQPQLRLGGKTEQGIQIMSIFQDHLFDIVQLRLDGLKGGEIAHNSWQDLVPLPHGGVGALITITEELAILVDYRALTLELDRSGEKGTGLAHDLPLLPQQVQADAALVRQGRPPPDRTRQERHDILRQGRTHGAGGRRHSADQASVSERERWIRQQPGGEGLSFGDTDLIPRRLQIGIVHNGNHRDLVHVQGPGWIKRVSPELRKWKIGRRDLECGNIRHERGPLAERCRLVTLTGGQNGARKTDRYGASHHILA
jgi:hypothetical protein